MCIALFVCCMCVYILYVFIVVDVLKKYYHSLLTNLIPQNLRNLIITAVPWLVIDKANLCCMSNKQFLDTLIMNTQNNHQLLRFCSTLNLFVNNSDGKSIIKTFKNGWLLF